MSSMTTNTTFGAPSGARVGAGQAGVDSSGVRPIVPGNVVPGWYSVSAICVLLAGAGGVELVHQLIDGKVEASLTGRIVTKRRQEPLDLHTDRPVEPGVVFLPLVEPAGDVEAFERIKFQIG